MTGSRIRFSKASQVFETYPDLVNTVAAPDQDVEPDVYAKVLLDRDNGFSALTYIAHVLPKREAVWWGHQCVSGLIASPSEIDAEVMRLTEVWVRDGDDDSREAIKEVTGPLTPDRAPIWIGLAAGFSGGSISPNPDYRVDAPADLTAKAVNAAVMIAVGEVGPQDRGPAIKACVDAGLDFARGGAMPMVTVTDER